MAIYCLLKRGFSNDFNSFFLINVHVTTDQSTFRDICTFVLSFWEDLCAFVKQFDVNIICIYCCACVCVQFFTDNKPVIQRPHSLHIVPEFGMICDEDVNEEFLSCLSQDSLVNQQQFQVLALLRSPLPNDKRYCQVSAPSCIGDEEIQAFNCMVLCKVDRGLVCGVCAVLRS